MKTRISGKGTRTRRAIAAAALGLALVSASAAHAGDYCFDAGQWSFVGKAFKPPKKGKCKAFVGYQKFAVGGTYVVSGTACTPAYGDFVDLVLTAMQNIGVDVLFENIHLPVKQGVAGTYRMTRTDGTWSTTPITNPGGFCPVAQPYNP